MPIDILCCTASRYWLQFEYLLAQRVWIVIGRAFMERDVIDFARKYPQLQVEVKPSKKSNPVAEAQYGAFAVLFPPPRYQIGWIWMVWVKQLVLLLREALRRAIPSNILMNSPPKRCFG